MEKRFDCPNNIKHGKVSVSKENYKAYRCYKCKVFACWDEKDLVELIEKQTKMIDLIKPYIIEFE